ncbi:hypothetical protein BGW80DRAFT_1557221 [Lactifluus volemus]|nr:hypothetical protein BGW80DRAFT_1557221 [Lactifluus volemus]
MSPSTVNFDKYSFKKYMKNIGRAYRKQAIELISACRDFVQAREQSYQSDIELRSALAAVDNALRCAAEAKGKTSKEADKNFKDATELLGNYEREYRFKGQDSTEYEKQHTTFLKKMEEATSKDKSSSMVLTKMKETLHSITHDESQEPTRIVEFRLCQSLTDGDPIVVHQTLGKSSNIQEILWNFSRYKGKKRLTLKENPHFYEHLPCSPEAYGNTFKANAIQDFQRVEKVYVLTDKVGRVYLETQAQDIRAFGNFWIPSNAIIFKDIHGMLEGERHVERTIDATPKIWYRKEHPSPPLPTPPVNSTSVVTMPVWKQVIRLTVDDRDIGIDIDIYISTRPPELEDDWLPSQLTTPSATADGLLPFPQAQSAPQELQTPAPSQVVRAHTSRAARGPLRLRTSALRSSLAPLAPHELLTPAPPLVLAHTSPTVPRPLQQHAEGEGYAPRQTVVSGTRPGNATRPAPAPSSRPVVVELRQSGCGTQLVPEMFLLGDRADAVRAPGS